MPPIRVLLADDHALFRQGVASLLATESDFEVVGEAADGLQALEKTRELKPDVILMDVSMPVLDGLEATLLIKSEWPDVRIVILTVSDGERNFFEAILCGASGYLSKSVEPQQLYGTLRRVGRREAPVSPVMAARLLEGFARRDPAAASATELTASERELLEQLALGRK
jgi:DNA-binding NarL/FixJ family response regulator